MPLTPDQQEQINAAAARAASVAAQLAKQVSSPATTPKETVTTPPVSQETREYTPSQAAAATSQPASKLAESIGSKSPTVLVKSQFEKSTADIKKTLAMIDANISLYNSINVGGEWNQYDWSKYPGGKQQYIADITYQKNIRPTLVSEYEQYKSDVSAFLAAPKGRTTKYYVTPSGAKYPGNQLGQEAAFTSMNVGLELGGPSLGGGSKTITFTPEPRGGFVGLGNISAESTLGPKLATNPLSLQLYQYAQTLPSEATGPFGFRYNPKGLFTIGSILTGSVENVVSPILNLIPGKQLFEVEPGMTSISWRNLPSELTETERKMGFISGGAAEFGLGVIEAIGIGKVAGAAVGAGGSILSKVPVVGSKLTAGGAAVSEFIGKRPIIGGLVLGAPIVALEGIKTEKMIQRGEPLQNILGSLAIDVGEMFAFSKGFSSGLATGQSLVNRAERAIFGGETIMGKAIVPEYVRSGESEFPGFKNEPYKPTPAGYKAMAESYAPPEIRIGEGVPSYSATTSQMGKQIVVGEGGPPYMYQAPALSPHFLRMGGAGESLAPGIPNIFGRPTIIYGEFEDVVASGAGKVAIESSLKGIAAGEGGGELGGFLKSLKGTGTLVMPAEQLGEAQAILTGGEKLTEIPGRFWGELDTGLVPIRRFLPALEGEAAGVSIGELASSGYSISGVRATTYLPSPSLLVSTPSGKPSTSKIVKYESPSLPTSISTPSSLKYPGASIISKYPVSSTTKYPGLSTPKYPEPSTIKYPEPSTPKYPEPYSPKYQPPAIYYPEPPTIEYPKPPSPPSYPKPPGPTYPGPKPFTPPSTGERKEKIKPKTEFDLFGKKRVTYRGLDLPEAVFGKRRRRK
jgi:hypothetical protein